MGLRRKVFVGSSSSVVNVTKKRGMRLGVTAGG